MAELIDIRMSFSKHTKNVINELGISQYSQKASDIKTKQNDSLSKNEMYQTNYQA